MSKIKFNKVSMRNFFSIGNSGLEFDYNSGLHAVTGHVEPSLKRNGTGKSTILADSITFGIYGKPLKKVNKEDIVNTINGKDCVVKVELEINKDKLIIERGVKPTYLKVWENGNEICYDSMKNTQKWLENKININHTCFTNIIVLNINHSQPFLSMDASSKRKVLEDILSLNIYSRMAEESKIRHLEAKTDVKVYETEVNSNKKALLEAQSNKDNITKKIEQFENEKIAKVNELENELSEKLKESKLLSNKIKDIKEIEKDKKKNEDKSEAILSKINEVNGEIRVLRKTIKDEKAALKILNDTPHCPTCHTPTDNPIVKKYIEDTKSSLENNQNELSTLEHKVEQAELILDKLKNNIESLNKEIKIQIKLNNNLEKLSHTIDTLQQRITEEQNRNLDFGEIISDDKIKELIEINNNSEILYSNSIKQFTYNKIMRSILGEDGVRKYVMSKTLPFLNKKVNNYLQLLGSDYSIIFDANLQERIIAAVNREERSYDSFSSGEKKRIDLSVLLSLMDVAKMQNSVDTNILILDEIIDSSMDSEGVENFLEFLATNFKEAYKDKAIYIITHRKEIGEGEYFDSMINLVKKNGFTRIDGIIQMK